LGVADDAGGVAAGGGGVDDEGAGNVAGN